jgi:hypothetical protein
MLLRQPVKHLLDPQLLHQPAHHMGRAEVVDLFDRYIFAQVHHLLASRKPRESLNQGINLAGRLKNVQPTEREQHLLADFSLVAIAAHDLKIGLASRIAINAHEHDAITPDIRKTVNKKQRPSKDCVTTLLTFSASLRRRRR